MNHTKSFECTICQIVYSTKQALKNHTAFVHEKLGHLCSLCFSCNAGFSITSSSAPSGGRQETIRTLLLLSLVQNSYSTLRITYHWTLHRIKVVESSLTPTLNT